jgi:hypothetical protein
MKTTDILNADRYTIDARLQKVMKIREKLSPGTPRWFTFTMEKNTLESRLLTLDNEEAARQERDEANRKQAPRETQVSQCSLCGELVRSDRVMQHWEESCRGQR